MMDDQELWDNVRKEIANAPERSAPPGAWGALEQQLPIDKPEKTSSLNLKLLWILLPLAFLTGWFFQPQKVEFALSDTGFPLQTTIEFIGPNVQGLPEQPLFEETMAPIVSIEDRKNKTIKTSLLVPVYLVEEGSRATRIVTTSEKERPVSTTNNQEAGAYSLTAAPAIESAQAAKTTVSLREIAETNLIVTPTFNAIPSVPEVALVANTSLLKKPVNAHQRIIWAAGMDSHLVGNKQRPSLHLSYRGSAWLGNLSWMAHVSLYRPRFGEELGVDQETDISLTPYTEYGTTVRSYGVEQTKLFAGVGLGYTFKIPSSRLSLYPFVSALYLISNNGEIRIDQTDNVTEALTTTYYNYVNNDTRPNRYLLQGGVDVQYQFSRRWAGAITVQRSTTFAMEKAHWQLRAGIHHLLN